MKDITVKSIQQIEPYSGPHQIAGIRFRPARQALGVTAWGMNVLELDPQCTDYPQHDHEQDGQEEVYVVLDGSVVLQAQGDERTLHRGDLVRVPAKVTRKFITKEEGATILALGGTPGKAYDVPKS